MPRLSIYLGAIAVFGLTACIDSRQDIYDASARGGDYAVLSCDELAIAERSIGQRLSGAANYAPADDPEALLGSQQAQIAAARSARDCPARALASAPVEVVEQADEDVALSEPAYLQVATFLVDVNRDDTLARLKADGFAVSSRSIQLAGETYYRVIIGPLTTVGAVARADKAAIAMGFDDAFFVKG